MVLNPSQAGTQIDATAGNTSRHRQLKNITERYDTSGFHVVYEPSVAGAKNTLSWDWKHASLVLRILIKGRIAAL